MAVASEGPQPVRTSDPTSYTTPVDATQLRLDGFDGELLGAHLARGGQPLEARSQFLGKVDDESHAYSLGRKPAAPGPDHALR